MRAATEVLVAPDVNSYKYDDFERNAELVRAGETAVRAAPPEVRKWLAAAQRATVPRESTLPKARVTQPAAMLAE